MMLMSTLLALAVVPASAWYRDSAPTTTADAPYPVPEDWKYNTVAAPEGIVEGKTNVSQESTTVTIFVCLLVVEGCQNAM
jgi:hypothetical protein